MNMNFWEDQLKDELIDAYLERLFQDNNCSVYDMTRAMEDYAYSSKKPDCCDYENCGYLDEAFDEKDLLEGELREYDEEIRELKTELKNHGMKMKFLKNNSILFTMEEEEEDV